MKKNVLITGGTGFVGRSLTKLLLSKGFSVSILSRTKRTNAKDVFYYTWDVKKQTIEEQAILNADYIVHLAGENIAGERWTAKRKRAIVDSRELSIKLLHTVLQENNKKLDGFISASAIGIYGALNGEEVCSENTPPANDFLGRTCQIWEAAADTIGALGIRTVKIRTGLVLGKNDGFLKKLKPIFKYRLGSALGSGKQYMPWVYIDDLCASFYAAINNESMHGPYNVALKDDTTNALFSKIFAAVYGYKIWLPNVPAFLIKLGMGEMSKIVLTGRRVTSDKLLATGFSFEVNDIEEALRKSI
ncbi:TIGR01777 family oxidoreductase [Flavobacterium sp. PL002]|uniref:TIGR01777 family oxidoreductase n=1 Tax=Flavobacterium sp. PL002 TaxID=1897058 RepID=UPI001788698D|nr:TIGR01777 family oxidoreductase [Flavobacterium sp. PL002]MBE0393135.1 Epimerase family protein [Flavobacterium sp. PL002]